MSGPRHLWSGDWESEAAKRRAERDERPAPAGPTPQQPDGPPEGEPRAGDGAGWRPTRVAVLTLVAVLVVAGIAVAVIAGSGSSNRRATAQSTNPQSTNPFGFNPGGVNRGSPTTPGQTTPGQTTTPGTTPGQSTTPGQTTTPAQSAPGPVADEPTIDWLGMQVQDSPGGQAVVDTVGLTGPAQAAGIEPGDEIVAIDGTPVDSVRAIRRATARLKLGAQLTLAIARGSTAVTTQVTLSGRPTTVP